MPSIIKVNNLGKEYRLGASGATYNSLRESLSQAVRAPWRKLNARRNQTHQMWALNDISFEVAPGETVGIIGRNGAGKSTLLKVLSRITHPTRGRVELYGRVGSLLEVGTGFHPELTGRENTYLNGAILGMTRAEIHARFDEIVEFAEITRFLDTPVKHYSSGMYTRLAFSVAAHLQPEILIVDEVLAVGDVQFQKKCLGKMEAAAHSGRTVLFVSHNMDAVRKLCQRSLLLERGRITADGETDAVIKKYIEAGVESQAIYDLPSATKEQDAPGVAYRLRCEDADGKPSVGVPVGQAWQVRVWFRIERRTPHFIIALGMTTPGDAALRTTWSVPQTIEPGEYQAVFRESSLMLAPGRYGLTIGLSSFERTFHYLPNAAALEIADYAEGVELVRIHQVGLVLNPLEVDILRTEDVSAR